MVHLPLPGSVAARAADGEGRRSGRRARARRRLLPQGRLAEEELDAYRAAFARPGRSKAAIDWYRAAFRRALRRRRRGPSPRVAAPTLILWGVEDRFLERDLVSPESCAASWRTATFPR